MIIASYSPIFVHKYSIPLKHAMRQGHLESKFLGTCQFLGNTMLFFWKFMKILTFFLYKSKPYDQPIKSYSRLKFWSFLTKKSHFLTLTFPKRSAPTSRTDSRGPSYSDFGTVDMDFQISRSSLTGFNEIFSTRRTPFRLCLWID